MAESIVNITFDTARFNQRLQQFLNATTREAEKVVFEVAAKVLGDVQQSWPVDTGVSRAAWYGPRKMTPLAYQIGNPIRYATTIEYGGFGGPGPGTVRFGPATLPGNFVINQGNYSRKVPAAPLRRALSKNYGELTTRVATLHRQHWGR
mgnify:CR=1 FL=1